MTLAAIRELLHQRPFVPFRIRLSNGDAHDVMNPHLVALMKSKVFIAKQKSESWAFISYLHIAALEHLTNGHSRGSQRERRR
jgi:hypothetical protein